MKELVAEILLRFVKPAAATVLGLIVYFVAVNAGGMTPGAASFLLCWVAGAAFVLLAESSPL